MTASKIEWTEETWNPVRGCSRVSPGCENCYAERQAIRHAGRGDHYEGLVRLSKTGPVWTGEVRFVASKLKDPFGWNRPRRVFVNSMSDLFHEKVSDEEIAAIFGVMAATERHTYQILTKRPERMLRWFGWMESKGRVRELLFQYAHAKGGEHLRKLNLARELGVSDWPLPNVWLGVSVEDQKRVDERVPLLLKTPASMRFVSYEPALGAVDLLPWMRRPLDPPGIDWVIVSGESGPSARPFDMRWALSAIEACDAAGIRCFVKQLGARPYENYVVDGKGLFAGGVKYLVTDPKGGDMNEWPERLRVRQYPEVRT